MSDYALAIRREARLGRKLLKLGTDRPWCVRCGMSDRRCLFRPRKARRSAPIRCKNCHAKRRRISAAAVDAKRRRFASAGYTRAACVACGEADLRALELDHLACYASSAFVEPLCRNCHAAKSDAAEDEPMASLRLRDPERGALAIQAAFQFGGAAVLTLIVAADGDDAGARAIFLLALAAALIAWALWNLKADKDLASACGPGRYYGGAICAEIPQ